MKYIFIFIVASSCALFRGESLSSNVVAEISSVCLDGSGLGRIKAQGRKFPFTFDMGRSDNFWLMSLNFPLYANDDFEVDLETGNYNDEIESSILGKAKGVDPIILENFLKSWARLVFEVNRVKEGKLASNSGWELNDNELQYELNKFKAKVTFSHKSTKGFFEKMTISFSGSSAVKAFSLQLAVRECLK